MFELLRSPSRSARGAIAYVTVGTLMVIWAGLWYWFFVTPQSPGMHKFLCVGIILSGFAIGIIGLLFGMIGRGAKAADNAVGVAPAGPIAPVVASAPVVPANVVADVSRPVIASTATRDGAQLTPLR